MTLRFSTCGLSPVRLASCASCDNISIVSAVYFSSRKSTLIGTMVDFWMGRGDCREGTRWLRCLSELKLSTKNSIMYWTVYFSRHSASSLFGMKWVQLSAFLGCRGLLSSQSMFQSGILSILISSRVVKFSILACVSIYGWSILWIIVASSSVSLEFSMLHVEGDWGQG